MSDLLDHGLDIVFCGTAKGKKSAAQKTYYAGSGNKFYETLYDAGLTPQQISPENFRDLLQFGLGLTDLNQTQSGMDRDIDMGRCDGEAFREKMAFFKPKLIAFTSLKAGRVYFGDERLSCGFQKTDIAGIRAVILPSTSGANNRWWGRDKHHWYMLKL